MTWQDNAVPADSWQTRAIPVDMSGPTTPLGATAKALWNILPQNPKNELKNLPLVTGALAGAEGIPMGGLGGTALGQVVRYVGDKIFNQPVQSPLQHGVELAGAGLADLTAFPAITRKFYGSQIGSAEKAAGVPAAKDISSTPMTLGQKSIGDFVNDAYDALKSETPKDFTFWKQLKDQTDRIYQMGKDAAITGLDKVRLQNLSSMAENGMNALVPGRMASATALARSQIVPNAIAKTVRSIPTWGKLALTGLGGDALLRGLESVGARRR